MLKVMGLDGLTNYLKKEKVVFYLQKVALLIFQFKIAFFF